VVAGFDAEETKAVLDVVEGHPLDEAGEDFTIGCLPILLERSPPSGLSGLVFGTEPSLTLAFVDPGRPIVASAGHVKDSLAASADVALDLARNGSRLFSCLQPVATAPL
jgi:hypothetical protein